MQLSNPKATGTLETIEAEPGELADLKSKLIRAQRPEGRKEFLATSTSSNTHEHIIIWYQQQGLEQGKRHSLQGSNGLLTVQLTNSSVRFKALSVRFGLGLTAHSSVWTISQNICGFAANISWKCMLGDDSENHSLNISKKSQLFARSERVIEIHTVFIGERNISWLLTLLPNYSNSLIVGLLVLTIGYCLALFSSVQLWFTP